MQSPARVKLLDPVVAERIAAGEVIERPSSVVKELVENSIDAGATEIAVVLSDGGKGLIEILDNGHGMQPEDLAICVQRHATSKLSSLQDLEKILTLGFRGEALPSIAAVSEMSILSRAQGAETAYEIREASARAVNPRPEAVTFGHFLNSPHGTRIRAAGLFSQVPARLKFLKSQGAEVSQVREWLERLALAHPKIGFRLVSDDRTVLTLKPQTEVERVRAILADGEDFPIVSAESERNGFQDRGLTVRAHWVQGLSTPQTRRLVQVVNGRAVRDRMLQQALLAPFRQALLPGQFPAVALFIEISPAAIDVNVHPTKTELRFLDSRKVFHEVERLVDSLIAKHGAAGYTPSAQPGPQAQPFFLNAGSRAFEAPIQQQTSIFSAPSWNASEATPESAKAPEPALHPLKFGRYVGVLFQTYIQYDLGQELALVDQHAAHERIRYEKLRSRMLSPDARPQPQALLLPEAIKFAPEERVRIESRLELLARAGFETELFGEDTVLFRGVPTEWGTDALRTRLKSLVERLTAQETPNALALDEELFETLASEACHSAIRAGDRLEDLEAQALVDELFRCEHPWNCPHGRPTVVRIPRGKLEEWFQRRV
ncbi:MAG: DNA mismatch repair endonuclease MutL [Bdellovibrionota bacterium]